MRRLSHRRVDDFADDIRKAHTFAQLRYVCVSFFREHGAQMMSYHHLPPPGALDYDPTVVVAAWGFPEAWVDHYIEKRYFEVDPIPQHALSVTEPFWWSEAAELPWLGQRALDYLEDLTEAQLGDGLAIPVFGPLSRNGYVGIGFGMEPPEITFIQKMHIQWACQLGHQRYCDLLRSDLETPPTLSEREREIIHWVVRGKSNSVIADILGISAYTVDTHLRRVYLKFEVGDRVTAALRAVAVGELL